MSTLLTSQVHNVSFFFFFLNDPPVRFFFQSTLSKVNSQQNTKAWRRKYRRGQNSATALRSKQEHKRCVMQPSGSLHTISMPQLYPRPLSPPTPMPQTKWLYLCFLHSESTQGSQEAKVDYICIYKSELPPLQRLCCYCHYSQWNFLEKLLSISWWQSHCHVESRGSVSRKATFKNFTSAILCFQLEANSRYKCEKKKMTLKL